MSPAPAIAARELAARRRLRLLAAFAGLLTLLVLVGTAPAVGYVRDEGIYFEASRHHAAWIERVGRSPGEALKPAVRDRHFRINREHPALMKIAAGVSAELFARPPAPGSARPDRSVDRPAGGRLPWLSEGTAMRLPAIFLAALGVVMLFLAGSRRGDGVVGGVLAAGAFILLPRVFFHAHLHAFDVPVAVATLAVWLCYQRSLEDPRFALLLGPLLGVAISIKHNALFLMPLLGLHYLACLAVARWRRGLPLRVAQLLPAPLISIALLAPFTVFALWPWLWSDPLGRLAEYLAFHREHAYYNMAFLGLNYNEPPMPVAYPWVMTLATVPLGLLVVALVGGVFGLRGELAPATTSATAEHPPTWIRPLPAGYPRLEESGLVLLALFPLLLISMPSIPIFGGTKHWITAYPFMALLIAGAFPALLRAAAEHPKLAFLGPRGQIGRTSRRTLALLAALGLLAPAAWSTFDGHPHNLSQYAPLAGGPRGAARLGLNRGFWGHSVGPLIVDLDAPGPAYLHDLHPLAARQYEREGRWPKAWKPVPPAKAEAALIFYEPHMLGDEIEVWHHSGRLAPAAVVTIDDVPLTARY